MMTAIDLNWGNDYILLFITKNVLVLFVHLFLFFLSTLTDKLKCKQIFAQILLTFRYGRDDEEVMGLKLSNESVLCVEQIYPLLPGAPIPQPLTKCQVLWKLRSVGHWRKCWCDHADERLNDVILFSGSADEATRTKCSSRQLKTESRRTGLGPSSAGKRVPRCRHWHQLRSQNLYR